MAPVPPLASQLADRVRTLRRVQLSDLPTARRQMAATAAALLAVQTQVLERVVVVLERVKYGAFARATKAKAEHLATVAQGVEGKLEYVTRHSGFWAMFSTWLLKSPQSHQARDSSNSLHTRDTGCAQPIQATYPRNEGSAR